VVERDSTYARSASALSAASIRQQFSSPVNIRISLHGIRFLRGIGETLAVDGDRPEIGLKEGGYLYCASDAGASILAENHAIQTLEGADIALLDPAGLGRRFPGSTRTISPAAASGSRGRAGSTAGACSRPFAARRARSALSIARAWWRASRRRGNA
jgi:glycine/D-amino acid oxidase-like deaminating enzyme